MTEEPGGAPDPFAPRPSPRELLEGFARRAAAMLPGLVARVALLGPRPAPDGDFPIAVVLREAVASPGAVRALHRVLEHAALPAVEEGCYVQVYLLHAGGPDAAQGSELWPAPESGTVTT